MATTTVDYDFRLSRVEAEGWNMAQEYLPNQAKKPDEFQIADLNPYRADPARGRWASGFNKAVIAMYAK
jgi:hypothetical protein